MTTTYIPTATDHPSIELPSDDDVVRMTIFSEPLADLADMIAGVRAAAGTFSAGYVIPLLRNTSYEGEQGAWYYDQSLTSVAGWVQHQVAFASSLYIEVDVPVGTKITQVGAYVRGTWNGNVHTQTPATMPSIALESVTADGVRTTVFTAQADTSAPAGSAVPADIAAYQASHIIQTLTGSVTVVDGVRYVIVITGEIGAGAQDKAFIVTAAVLTRTAP